jgi:hypothetical protein
MNHYCNTCSHWQPLDDAVYEQMRYERLKERPKAYWQKVRDERKQRLNMMVGSAA